MTFVAQARVAHKYDSRFDFVTLRVMPIGATISEDFRISAGEARRLGWALLADLCPDEVESDLEAALEVTAALQAPTGPNNGATCSCGRLDVRMPRGHAGAILTRLDQGEMTAAEAGLLIGRSTSIASSFIVQMVKGGLVARLRGGLFNDPTVYGITALGRAALRSAAAR